MSHRERLFELLADEALCGLDAEEATELRALLAAHPDVAPDTFALTAAELHAEWLDASEVQLEPLSDALTERIAAAAVEQLPQAPDARGGRLLLWTGWLAAAAVLALSFTLWPREDAGAPGSDPEADRQRLVAHAVDLLRVPWSKTEDVLVAEAEVAGEVVWSGARQEGYVTLSGLPVNDPAREQYQLWIFDGDRPQEYPVDGGVFDVGADGEIVIPIDAKLGVEEPVLFAVTLERPGGVVVTTRERLLLVAPVQ